MSGSLAVVGRNGRAKSLTGGVDIVFDCVGSAASLSAALSIVRPGGDVVAVGMPGALRLDLAPLWQREVRLRGSYAYGTEHTASGPRRTFDMAAELVFDAGLERLVTAAYQLDHYEAAIAHAASAGRRGAVKIVFDMRRRRRGNPGGGNDTAPRPGVTENEPPALGDEP
jgi:threonine dehydrogenase-like Zn-dependent dehydrogenase